MTKFGRPREKDSASKLTLYLEDSVIEALDDLAVSNKTSRSRIVEKLVREHRAALKQMREQIARESERVEPRKGPAARPSSTVPSDAIALAQKAEEKHDRARRKS